MSLFFFLPTAEAPERKRQDNKSNFEDDDTSIYIILEANKELWTQNHESKSNPDENTIFKCALHLKPGTFSTWVVSLSFTHSLTGTHSCLLSRENYVIDISCNYGRLPWAKKYIPKNFTILPTILADKSTENHWSISCFRRLCFFIYFHSPFITRFLWAYPESRLPFFISLVSTYQNIISFYPDACLFTFLFCGDRLCPYMCVSVCAHECLNNTDYWLLIYMLNNATCSIHYYSGIVHSPIPRLKKYFSREKPNWKSAQEGPS